MIKFIPVENPGNTGIHLKEKIEKMDSHTKARYEKDIRELKKMCDDHFKQREEDEKEFVALQERIAKRKEVKKFVITKNRTNDHLMTRIFKLRATQMEAKVAKEKERAEKEKIMAEEKAAEEGKKISC